VFYALGALNLLLLAHLQPKLPFSLVAPGPLEAWAVLTGALCVWLTVVRHILNFPIGIVSSILFAVMFFEIKLFGDMYLQLFFIAMALHGWYWWLKGGENRTKLEVTKSTFIDWIFVVAAMCLGTPFLIFILTKHSSLPFWDAFTTVGSIVAQIMLNRKKFETWYIWIAVDIIYVPVYWHKDYRLTAVLYAVFLVMCVAGLLDWKRELQKKHGLEPAIA
jgi:nicotinamide mononucleotide transporter